MNRRIIIALLTLIAIHLDTVVWGRINILGARPDMLLSVIITLGVMLGRTKACIAGGITGLYLDIAYGPNVGMTAAAMIFAAIVGGYFHDKYYADNNIVPMVIAGIVFFIKECIIALSLYLFVSKFDYLLAIVTYILPCTVLTMLTTLLISTIFLRPYLRMRESKQLNHPTERTLRQGR